jgi:hypothetical protein
MDLVKGDYRIIALTLELDCDQKAYHLSRLQYVLSSHFGKMWAYVHIIGTDSGKRLCFILCYDYDIYRFGVVFLNICLRKNLRI